MYDDVVIIYIGRHDFAPGAKIKSQYLSEPINNMFCRLIYIDQRHHCLNILKNNIKTL